MRWIRVDKPYPANWHYLGDDGKTALCGEESVSGNRKFEYRATQNLMRNNICSRCRSRIIEQSPLLREAAQLMKGYR